MPENLYWAIPEKIQRGFEDMDGIFRGIEGACGNSRKKWNFQGCSRKTPWLLSMASWFLTLGISTG